MALPLRSFVPLFVVLPDSFTGVLDESPPQAMANRVIAAARIRILRMPEHTDRGSPGIAPRRNLFRRPTRTTVMWEASDEALLAGLAVGDRDAALVFVRRFQ